MRNVKLVKPPSGKKAGRPRKHTTKEAKETARKEAFKKQYYKNKDNPEFKKRRQAYNKKYYKKNKDKILADCKRRYDGDAAAIRGREARAYYTKEAKRLWMAEAVQELLAAEIQKHLNAFQLESARKEINDILEDVKELCADVEQIKKYLKWGQKNA